MSVNYKIIASVLSTLSAVGNCYLLPFMIELNSEIEPETWVDVGNKILTGIIALFAFIIGLLSLMGIFAPWLNSDQKGGVK